MYIRDEVLQYLGFNEFPHLLPIAAVLSGNDNIAFTALKPLHDELQTLYPTDQRAFSLNVTLLHVRNAAKAYYEGKGITLPREAPTEADAWAEVLDIIDALLAKGNIPVPRDDIVLSAKLYTIAPPPTELSLSPRLTEKLGMC